MASSSSRKSSSSASSGPKSSYRRAAVAPGAKPRVAQGSVVPRRSVAGAKPSTGAKGMAGKPRQGKLGQGLGARVASKGPSAPVARPTKRAGTPRVAAAPGTPRPRPTARAKAPRQVAAPSRPFASPAAPRPAAPKMPTPKPSAPPARKGGAPRAVASPAPKLGAKTPIAFPKVAKPALKLPPKPGAPVAGPARRPAQVGSVVARALAPIAALAKRVPVPRLGRGPLLIGAAVAVAVALVAIVVVNSPLLGITTVQARASEHMTEEAAEKLIKVPEGSTLLNVDTDAIAASLSANPWISGVDVERSFPHTLIVTPRERKVSAIAYITADDIAWAIGEDATWIAPMSLSATVDAEGAEIDPPADGVPPEGARQLTGLEAAQHIARRDGALLLVDVPSDVDPSSGKEVTSEVVLAGLEYAKGFTPEFMGQVKDLSVASVEAISANLTSGIEVSLGKPERITEKERVVVKLLEQETGVTYINVREPGAYTFRSAPQ